MLTENANTDPFLTFWLRVREFAVPPSMIETATARRSAGDWAGACAAAGVDVRTSRPAATAPSRPRRSIRRGPAVTSSAWSGGPARKRHGPRRRPPRPCSVPGSWTRPYSLESWDVHEVVVRGLGGTWPRATLPRLAPERFPQAVDFARRAVCGLLSARPALVHRLPSGETRRGGAWPSPRSWEMTLRLIAFATAAGASRDVLSLLVRGAVGDGPGLELLASLDRMDLPDPEDLLADPAGAELPERGDLRQAVLDGVVAAVRRTPEKSRWDAAWALLVRALETGAPDLVVVPATTLAALRQQDWDVPESIEALAGTVSLARRAEQAAARAAVATKARR
ncbi:hypothetical protein ACWF9B_13105 [Streptomyces sp. NPDC055089]